MTPDSTRPPLGERLVPLIPWGIALTVFLVNLPFASLGLLSPDACLYLDIGRNIFSGNGAVTSFNFYQFWPGKYYPALPYVPPIYPVFAGLVWKLAGLKGAIGANILILGANCALLYAILSRTSGRLAAALVAIYVGTRWHVVLTALLPWTEQLHLLFILAAIFLHLRETRREFLVGVILGASCLVRIASLYNIAAFAISTALLEGLSWDALKRQAKTALGVLAVLVPYQAFCWLVYGRVFPQYTAAATSSILAESYPGASYALAMPVLKAPPMPLATGNIVLWAISHLGSFKKAFGREYLLLALAPLALYLSRERRRNPVFVTLLVQGFAPIALFSISLSWKPIVDAYRYNLIPFIMIASSALVLTRELAAGYLKGLEQRFRLATILVFAPFFALSLTEAGKYHRNHALIRPHGTAALKKDKAVVYRWIRENTPGDALVASDQLSDPFLFERPFVRFPPGAAFTPKTVEEFMGVFKPEYVLTENPALFAFLLERGYERSMETRLLAVLRRRK
ncbi:MAG: hypothetical protein HY927_07765 [Elusimicrobia bacterium]|nr:hypothetical protein [Elusimicrobiota bacterium]